ncbi:MAG: EpsI family protein [Planctomycetes bacterium]|nr:EpsI family protein [Planctomycetota bacterium]
MSTQPQPDPTAPAPTSGSGAPPRAISIPVDERPRLRGVDVRALLAAAALLTVGWWNTFGEMWLRWFPAWTHTDLSLSKRLTEGDSYYTHGPMVPLISLFIAFCIHRRVGAPCSRTTPSRFLAVCVGLLSLVFIRLGASYMGEALGRATFLLPAGACIGVAAWLYRRGGTLPATLVGGLMLAGSLLLHLLSVYARVTFVSGFALIGTLAALVVLWGGWSLLRAYWLPVVFLIFMVPLPMEKIAQLNFELKFLAGEAAVWTTNRVFHVPAVMSGSYVHFLPGPDGQPKTLVVEDVCSGLRSMISLICFASLFALVCRVKGLWRVLLLLLAVPVAVFCNIARMTFLNLIAHYYTTRDAGPDSALHGMSGMLVFALALAILFGVEQIILFAGRRLHRDWSDERLLGFLDALPRLKHSLPAVARPGVLAALALSAVLSLYWSRQAVAQNVSGEAKQAVPASVTIDGKVLKGQDYDLDEKTLIILETNDYIYRRYAAAATGRGVDLLIVFSASNRKGTHPPEVCLQGADQQITSKQEYEVKLPRTGSIRMRELITQRSRGGQTLHLYVYKCGDKYTPDFTAQQATIFINSLLRRNASGALIRYSVDVTGDDLDAARRTAVAAVEATMPVIDKHLP